MQKTYTILKWLTLSLSSLAMIGLVASEAVGQVSQIGYKTYSYLGDTIKQKELPTIFKLSEDALYKYDLSLFWKRKSHRQYAAGLLFSGLSVGLGYLYSSAAAIDISGLGGAIVGVGLLGVVAITGVVQLSYGWGSGRRSRKYLRSAIDIYNMQASSGVDISPNEDRYYVSVFADGMRAGLQFNF